MSEVTPGWRGWRTDLSAALPGWVTARVLVALALVAAWWVRTRSGWAVHGLPYGQAGLMGWDAEWYAIIAERGYDAGAGAASGPHEGVRFFPLLPVLARGLGAVIGVPAALLVLANGPALVLGAAVHRLAWRETGRRDVARLAAWLVALAPPAFVLVMGYTEPIALLCIAATFLALRSRRWWLAALANLIGGMIRPTGLFMGLPTLVEAGRAWWTGKRRLRDLVASLAACAAPAVGGVLFMVFCWYRYGDALAPYTTQSAPHLRGGTVNPLRTVWETAAMVFTRPAALNLHRVTVLASLVLAVPTVRRWPPRLWSYYLVAMAVAFAGARLGSLERYMWGSVVLVLTAAWLARGPVARWVVVALSGAAMFVCATTAFLGTYVP